MATVEFQANTGKPPVKALVDSMTEAILFGLADGLGMDASEGSVSAVVRPLFERPEEEELVIDGCFDQGYDPQDDEDYEQVLVKRRKDGKVHLDGNGAEVLLKVEAWRPDPDKVKVVREMSHEELVQRVLELEAVL